jgi:hypothetical protein
MFASLRLNNKKDTPDEQYFANASKLFPSKFDSKNKLLSEVLEMSDGSQYHANSNLI